jgi:gamma-glutamylcyclotransferase (GGCT)/AIG2-like uncharacterized protein YtfP
MNDDEERVSETKPGGCCRGCPDQAQCYEPNCERCGRCSQVVGWKLADAGLTGDAVVCDECARVPDIVRLFVYGTLKAGHWNHHFIEDAAVHSYTARVEGYSLYGVGIPYAVPEVGAEVQGEVYHFADPSGEVLARLDRLEGHPIHYRRTRVHAIDSYGEGEDVWMYVRAGGAANLANAPRIGSTWPAPDATD